jgi:small-conductance mechanosensitive channel
MNPVTPAPRAPSRGGSLRPGLPAALGLLLALLLAPLALAQSNADRQAAIDGWRATLAQTEAALGRPDLSVADLDEHRDRTQAVLAAARAMKAELDPKVADLDAQLKALVPDSPADSEGGTAEPVLPPAVKEIHDQLEAEYQAVSALAQQAGVIIVQAVQLLEEIAARRDAEFSARLFDRDESVLSPALWVAVAEGVPVVLAATGRVLASWVGRIAESFGAAAPWLFLAALLVIAVIVAVRVLFVRWTRAWTATQQPTPSRKVLMATAVVIADIGVPMLILFGLRSVFGALGLLPPNVHVVFDGVILAVAVYAVTTGVARALAAPGRPEWRIGGIHDETARHAYRIVTIAAFLLALGPLVDHLGRVAAMPPDWAVRVGGILSVPTALLALYATRILVQGRERLSEEESARSARWRILTPLAAFAAIVTIVAAVIGYLAFARFMIEQIAWVWVVAGVYVIAIGLADLGINAIFMPNRQVGAQLGRTIGLSDSTVERGAVVFSGIARIVLFLLAALVVLAPWGFDSTTFLERISGLYYGVEIGSIRVTFASVITALIVFAVLIFLSRVFQRWLDQRFLPTTSIDPGLKNSIHTSVGYIGIILAAILALGYAGIDLGNVALVAGALSVGIGFGLQSIVNNFVSGLILLAERPIRAGDWIQVGTDEGTVKKISVRATEIETFDRASVIIPNSSLISGVVKNWYLRDNSGRTMVTVGVGYGSDPEQVKAILADVADRHELVLKFPAPIVTFSDFGDSALVFNLYVYLASISSGLTVRSDLRFAILKRLREAGIEIPYPQRDINLRDWPKMDEALRGMAENGEGTKRN